MLKRDKRHLYRHSLSDLQKAFLEIQLSKRIPASYRRFLWFMAALGVALFSLVAGQGKSDKAQSHRSGAGVDEPRSAYTSMYFQTLPHSSLDAGIWVWSVSGALHSEAALGVS